MIPDPNPRNFDGAWTYAALTDAQFDLFFRSFGVRLREAVAAFEPDVIECQHIWSMPYACAREGVPVLRDGPPQRPDGVPGRRANAPFHGSRPKGGMPLRADPGQPR